MILLVACAAGVAVGLFLLATAVTGRGWACVWKGSTGWPCASCGGTRSLMLLGNGQWMDALALNPGVVAASVGMGVAAIYAAAVLVLRLEPWRPRLAAWRLMLAAVFILNWAYVIWAGRV